VHREKLRLLTKREQSDISLEVVDSRVELLPLESSILALPAGVAPLSLCLPHQSLPLNLSVHT